MSTERDQRGVSSLEVLAATTLLSLALLSIATMYLTSHVSLDRSGESTLSVALARQLFEDAHTLRFAELDRLDGLDTADASTLPVPGLARGVARRWRYAAAGEDGGWALTDQERARWATVADASTRFRGRLEVTPTTPSTRSVTVTLEPTDGGRATTMTTVISRTFP